MKNQELSKMKALITGLQTTTLPKVSTVVYSLLLTMSAASNAWADKVKLLHDNLDAMQTRVDLVMHAKKEILVEYYEVANDRFSYTGLALLRKAAERGIKVKILFDDMHNSLSAAELATMMGINDNSPVSKNIELKVFNPLKVYNPLYLTYRNHDKLLNIDGETDDAMMVIGGRNVAETYFGKSETLNFKDADALVIGDAARAAHDYFMALWNSNPDVADPKLYSYTDDKLNASCFGSARETCLEDQARRKDEIEKAKVVLRHYLASFEANKSWVQARPFEECLKGLEDIATVKFAFNDPTKVMADVEHKLSAQAMASFEKNAKETLLVVTPYLFPTESELQTLERLSARGIKIKLVTNSLASTDTPLVHAALLTIKKRLADMGAEIYLFKGPEVLHSKGVIIDGKIAMIGSFNFDRRSALLNREIGIRVGSPDDKEASQFTKSFLKFIDHEIIKNSVLVVKDGIELENKETEELDAMVSVDKKQKLERAKLFVNMLADQI